MWTSDLSGGRYSFHLQILLVTFYDKLSSATIADFLLWCSADTVLTMCLKLDEGCTACIAPAGVLSTLHVTRPLSTCCSWLGADHSWHCDSAWFSHHPVRGEVLYHCVAVGRKQGVTHSFFQQWHIYQYIIPDMVFLPKPEWNIMLTR